MKRKKVTPNPEKVKFFALISPKKDHLKPLSQCKISRSPQGIAAKYPESLFNPFRYKRPFEEFGQNWDPKAYQKTSIRGSANRNFCRDDHFRYHPSTRQKFRLRILGSRFFGMFLDPNTFDQNFRMDSCNEKG